MRRMLHGDELVLAADSLAKLGKLLGLAGAESEEAIGYVCVVDKDDCFVFAIAHKALVRWGYGQELYDYAALRASSHLPRGPKGRLEPL